MSVAELVNSFATLEVSGVNDKATEVAAKVSDEGVTSIETNKLMAELQVRQPPAGSRQPCSAAHLAAQCSLRTALRDLDTPFCSAACSPAHQRSALRSAALHSAKVSVLALCMAACVIATLSLTQTTASHTVVFILQKAASDKKSTAARAGAAATALSLAKTHGTATEPYLMPAVTWLLDLASDKEATVRDTATEAVKYISVEVVTPVSICQAMPQLLGGLAFAKKWQTKVRLLLCSAACHLVHCLACRPSTACECLHTLEHAGCVHVSLCHVLGRSCFQEQQHVSSRIIPSVLCKTVPACRACRTAPMTGNASRPCQPLITICIGCRCSRCRW